MQIAVLAKSLYFLHKYSLARAAVHPKRHEIQRGKISQAKNNVAQHKGMEIGSQHSWSLVYRIWKQNGVSLLTKDVCQAVIEYK